jgi:hypothetical protein
MAHFNFTVDTEEMANSIDRVAPHVDGTTAAVVAMQTAVIIAEKRAAEKICDNVNRGFFGLIRSQISQKLAICKSQMDARVMELGQQSQELLGIRGRMERDFQMIATRYAKLFRSLDAALYTRINELDKPLVSFVSRDLEKTRNRTRFAQATVPIHQSETINASQLIAVSQAKASTARAIGCIHQFVHDANQQHALVGMMLGDSRDGASGSVQVPVMFMESDNTRTRVAQWQFHYPPGPAPLTRRIAEAIEGDVLGRSEKLEWTAAAPESKDRVYRLFLDMTKGDQVNDRVRTLMIQLFNASRWQQPDRART